MIDNDSNAKSSFLTINVPRGVHGLDEEGNVVNRYYIVTLREPRGEEEDILAEENMSFAEKMKLVLMNYSIISIEAEDGSRFKDLEFAFTDTSHGFLFSDVFSMWWALVKMVSGDEYSQIVECPKCKVGEDRRPYSWTHIGSRNDAEIFLTEGDLNTNTRVFTAGNLSIEWEMLTAAKYFSEKPVMNKKSSRSEKKSQRATMALMQRVKKINGKEVTAQDVRDLRMSVRQNLRDEFDKEGGVDTDLEFECENCGEVFIEDMEGEVFSFFQPSAKRKRSKKR